MRTLDYFVTKKAERYYNNSTQTEESRISIATGSHQVHGTKANQQPNNSISTQTANAAKRDHSTNTIGGAVVAAARQHSAGSSASSTANSTPSNSRPNSKQSGIRKPMASASTSKLPVSQSDSTISLTAYHAAAKEDAHLLATLRGMRVDLAIKDKAVQRLSKDLEECKKTIRKMQKEKEGEFVYLTDIVNFMRFHYKND